jgi:endonuclease III-like uncharacterized protein
MFVQDVIGKLNYVSAKSRHKIKQIVGLGTTLNNILLYIGNFTHMPSKNYDGKCTKPLGSGMACMDSDINSIIDRIIIAIPLRKDLICHGKT